MSNLMEIQEKKAKADFNDSSIVDHKKKKEKMYVLLAKRDEEISHGGKCHGHRRRFKEHRNEPPKERLL